MRSEGKQHKLLHGYPGLWADNEDIVGQSDNRQNDGKPTKGKSLSVLYSEMEAVGQRVYFMATVEHVDEEEEKMDALIEFCFDALCMLNHHPVFCQVRESPMHPR